MDRGDDPNLPPYAGRGRGALLKILLENRNRREAAALGIQPEAGDQPTTSSDSGRVLHSPEHSSGLGTNPTAKSSSSSERSQESRSHRGAFLKTLSLSSSDSGRDSAPLPKFTGIGRGRAKLLEQLTEKLRLDPGVQVSTETPHDTSRLDYAKSETSEKSSYFEETLHEEIEEKVEQHLGTSGYAIDVSCNYIKLNIEPDRGVFEYEVRFNPDLDSRGLRINLLNQHIRELGGVKTFDGVTLYLPIKLDGPKKQFVSINPMDQTQVTVLVIFKRKKRLGECIHLYNVLLKRIMGSLDLVRFKRQHFDPSAPKILPQHQLEVWPGYVTAVDEYEGGIMLCLDISHRVLRQKTVLDFLRNLVNTDRASVKDKAIKALVGSCILTRYNNRSYPIHEVAFNMSPMSTFENSRGESSTFVDYYKKQYGIDILDLNQPLLVSNSVTKVSGKAEPVETKLCLIPELSYLTGLTDENRNDFRLMKDIATFTKITPNQRVYGLRKFVENVNANKKSQELLSSWGLSLSKDCIKMSARTLMPEEIRFGQGQTVAGTANADWGRASTNNHVMNAVNLQKWVIFYTNRDAKYMKDFQDCMKRCGPPMGITVVNPITISLQSDRTEMYLDAIRKVMQSTPDVQMLVFIFPTSRDDRYSAVKKLCCVDYGIASQVINSRTISKPDKIRSIVQKIALQMNCKLGGSLWSVSIPLKNCMICGVDTYHDPTRRGKSVVGFVASMNQSCTKYFSQVAFQNPHEELGQSLQNAFRNALKKYFDSNGALPEKIIFFRDGVGDGQLEHCRDVEVRMLEECFNIDMFKQKPQMTYIIVQKRINTRIMALKGRSEHDNPGPGTIVDHTVTRRSWYDFFLVPQSVRQGTVSPTHYVVLRDTSAMRPDHVQRLSFKMCHLYYNWAGTVRVPACCQYAHKLAYLVGQSVRQKPNDKLMDYLYYL